MTGSEAFGVVPDMMNVAKQLTNGAQPLGAVVVSDEIHDVIMGAGGPEYMIEFPHGYTYSAHPVACAAAMAALDVLQREGMIERVRALAPYFEQAVHSLKGVRHITDIRNFGLAAGITLEALPGEPARRPFEAAMGCWRKSVYVRFGGDTLQLAPPFISEKADIDRLVAVVGESLGEVA
jgi:beta-alanine--pyruvate transaminase